MAFKILSNAGEFSFGMFGGARARARAIAAQTDTQLTDPATPEIPMPPTPPSPPAPPVEVPAQPAPPDLPPEHTSTQVAA
jgi:hypothetical protein